MDSPLRNTSDPFPRMDLHAPNGAGGYDWGSLVCHFYATPVKVRSYAEMLASISTGARYLDFAGDDVAMQATVSFIHESVHLMQDATTGVGHWDYLQRRNYIPKILASVRFLGWYTGVRTPFTIDQFSESAPSRIIGFDGDTSEPFRAEYSRMRDTLESFVRYSIFEPSSSLHSIRRNALIKFATARSLGSLSETEIVEEVRMLEPESILECDAAFQTLSWILRSRWTDEDDETLKEIGDSWKPGSMPDPYRSLFAAFYGSMGFKGIAGEIEPTGLVELIEVFARVIDICLAHPSPSFLAASNLEYFDFEPGVRFAE